MSDLVRPGAGIIFMKVGTHAKETLGDIIARKQKEISDEGVAYWGYGGGTCHPLTTVQPFARSFEQRGSTIYLCMEEIPSRHFAEPVRAKYSSSDGVKWDEIPRGINVLGSRYALVVDELAPCNADLSLDDTEVGIGNQKGRNGAEYIKGRVDKACLVVHSPGAAAHDENTKHLSLSARLRPPYAVLLR